MIQLKINIIAFENVFDRCLATQSLVVGKTSLTHNSTEKNEKNIPLNRILSEKNHKTMPLLKIKILDKQYFGDKQLFEQRSILF
jgi:hypothetical protein